MKLLELHPLNNIENNPKLNELFLQFEQLLQEINKHPLSESTIKSINKDIEAINAAEERDNQLFILIKKKQANIIKVVEKEHKIVPKEYYQKLWLALGLASFGVPLGVIVGVLMKNMALLGLGIPIGLGIGAMLGRSMDKKAAEEGRQLDISLKY